MEIKVPHLAENVENGTIVSILVQEGDVVKKDQPVVEIETAKAVAPIPSPVAGRVARIHVKTGEEVPVGKTLVTVAEDGVSAAKEKTPVEKATLKKIKKPAQEMAEESPVEEAPEAQTADSGIPPAAPPSVRKVARQLGIDLRQVGGSERGGRITLNDVKAYIAKLQKRAEAGAGVVPAKPAGHAVQSIDFSKWGPVTRKKLSSLRKTIGQRVTESWNTIPHVTQFDEADITKLMEYRKKYGEAYETRKGHLTITSFAIKAAVTALKKFPLVNSSLDEAADEVVYKEYFHIGIAVDTEAGLIVPVIRDADKKSLLQISVELDQLAERTRRRKVSLEELEGASFTISNLGGIGSAHFTPIVNKPNVAILGIGRGGPKPVFVNNKLEARILLPLALSYDHRVVDGADGARFIRAFVEALEQIPESDVRAS
ncbi:MAG: 2-oxo acid dehydrogenase subunit E2 [Candidatus Omnitrophica bacterium]|nr:2-oxo acid dehydrogenase subunit E2 [Candidatus Omnitrophota bacterium]